MWVSHVYTEDAPVSLTLSRPGLFRAAFLLGAITPLAAAQAPPDTGRLMQDQERLRLPAAAPRLALPRLEEAASPASDASDGLRVRTTAFRFSRNSAFDDATLAMQLADLVGQELGLADLHAAAARITAYYRQHGYFVASAYLPAQDIRDGVVQLTVLEGQLGKLRVDNRSPVAEHVVRAFLPELREGSPLRDDTLERGLLLLNGLPGVEVQSTLKPGASLGTTDLDLRIGGQRTGGNLSLDDFGNRFSGAWRAGAQLNVNSPLGLGDVLTLRASQSDAQFRYARLAYQLPAGGRGLQLGGAWSAMRYRLGQDFAVLLAHGSAEIGSAYALYPLQRRRDTNLNLQANLDHKHLVDRTDSTEAMSDKTITLLTLGISGDQSDGVAGGGATSWSLAYTGGNLRLDPLSARFDAAGQRAGGGYNKWTLLLGRQQRLGGLARWSVSGQASVQLAGKNLDTSEKFSLGGVQGVRAYPQGEAACDDALLASLALNYAPGAAWQLSGFVDGAAGRLNHTPIPAATNNRQTLSGGGLGVNYTQPGGLSVAATLAWRSGRAPLSDRDRAPRLWMSLQTYF